MLPGGEGHAFFTGIKSRNYSQLLEILGHLSAVSHSLVLMWPPNLNSILGEMGTGSPVVIVVYTQGPASHQPGPEPLLPALG